MDMQLAFGVLTSVATIVFATLYLREVWKCSTDRVERDTYDAIRSTTEYVEREIDKLKAQMEALKEKQNKYSCHYNKPNDHLSEYENKHKLTKTTR